MKLEKLTVAIKNVRPLVISEQMAADLVEESKNILLKKLEITKQILINEFHPKKIILHGSLAQGKDVHPFSDIDLVVEGLEDDYLGAGGRLIDALGECLI